MCFFRKHSAEIRQLGRKTVYWIKVGLGHRISSAQAQKPRLDGKRDAPSHAAKATQRALVLATYFTARPSPPYW